MAAFVVRASHDGIGGTGGIARCHRADPPTASLTAQENLDLCLELHRRAAAIALTIELGEFLVTLSDVPDE